MTTTDGPYRGLRDPQGLQLVRELIEEALESLGCTFADDIRPGAEHHLSRAIDAIEVVA